MWQNTKNLAKPRHRATLPFRYPRACLPVPAVDLKNPTWWGGEKTVQVKTNWVNKDIGDIFNWPRDTYKILVCYWDLPKRALMLKDGLNIRVMFNLNRGNVWTKIELNLPSYGTKTTNVKSFESTRYREFVHEENNGNLLDGLPESYTDENFNVTVEHDNQGPKVTNLQLPPLTDSFSKIYEMENVGYRGTGSQHVDLPSRAPYFIPSYVAVADFDTPQWESGYEMLVGGSYLGSNWWKELPEYKYQGSYYPLKPGIGEYPYEVTFISKAVLGVVKPAFDMIFEDLLLSLGYAFNVKLNKENNRLELWIESREGNQKPPIGRFGPLLYSLSSKSPSQENWRYGFNGHAYYDYISHPISRVKIDNKPNNATLDIPDYIDLEISYPPPEKE